MIFYLGSLTKVIHLCRVSLRRRLPKRDELSLEVSEKSRLLETATMPILSSVRLREKLGFVYSNEHVYIDISGD